MTKTKFVYAAMGSVSNGTMREEDLIPDFVWTLKHLAKQNDNQSHLTLCDEIEERMEEDDYYASEDASFDLNEGLFNALNEYALPYFYFGSHPGDGADYGFWLSEFFEDGFEGLKVEDTSEVPNDYSGEVLHVNDHGNMTLYAAQNGKLEKIWGIV